MGVAYSDSLLHRHSLNADSLACSSGVCIILVPLCVKLRKKGLLPRIQETNMLGSNFDFSFNT